MTMIDTPAVGTITPAARGAAAPARVLLVHTYYQQRGGEDEVFDAESRLLEARGHEVVRYAVHNDAIEGMGRGALVRATLWNREAARAVGALVRRHRPAVVHAHNTFPLLSPAVYGAARAGGAATVQTLHNFRAFCAKAVMHRDGAPCARCTDTRTAWPALAHRCYRGSAAATAVVVGMQHLHRARRTWERDVDLFLAPSAAARAVYVTNGWAADRIVVKPNFVERDPGARDAQRAAAADRALFVARLSAEKGVRTLLAAWRAAPDLPPLDVIGDGPLAGEVAAAAAADPRIAWHGRQPHAAVLDAMRAAAFVVLPSECFEVCPLALLEAFACGVPVVAAALGAPADVVEPGRTGWLFAAGDARALAARVREAWAGRRTTTIAAGHAARAEYLARYSADAGYAALAGAYDHAVARAGVAA